MTCNLIELADSIDAGMTDFQIETFVLREQQTPYRRVRQGLIELRTRLEVKVMHSLDLEELELDIQELESTAPSSEFALRKNAIAIRRKKYERDRKLKTLTQVEREIKTFSDYLDTEIATSFGTFDEFKNLLNDPARLAALELEYWKARFTRGAVSDLTSTSTISKGSVEAILSLSESDRKAVLEAAIDESVGLLKAVSGLKAQALANLDK